MASEMNKKKSCCSSKKSVCPTAFAEICPCCRQTKESDADDKTKNRDMSCPCCSIHLGKKGERHTNVDCGDNCRCCKRTQMLSKKPSAENCLCCEKSSCKSKIVIDSTKYKCTEGKSKTGCICGEKCQCCDSKDCKTQSACVCGDSCQCCESKDCKTQSACVCGDSCQCCESKDCKTQSACVCGDSCQCCDSKDCETQSACVCGEECKCCDSEDCKKQTACTCGDKCQCCESKDCKSPSVCVSGVNSCSTKKETKDPGVHQKSFTESNPCTCLVRVPPCCEANKDMSCNCEYPCMCYRSSQYLEKKKLQEEKLAASGVDCMCGGTCECKEKGSKADNCSCKEGCICSGA